VHIGANDVWAAGSYNSHPGPGLTLAIHWNGTTWKQVPTESPGADDNNFGIGGIAAVNADHVLAVGTQWSHDEFKTHQDTLIEQSDGTAFTTVVSPNPGYYNSLMAVSALPSGAAWAVACGPSVPSRLRLEHGVTTTSIGPRATPTIRRCDLWPIAGGASCTVVSDADSFTPSCWPGPRPTRRPLDSFGPWDV
jgi:hypothetical protein